VCWCRQAVKCFLDVSFSKLLRVTVSLLFYPILNIRLHKTPANSKSSLEPHCLSPTSDNPPWPWKLVQWSATQAGPQPGGDNQTSTLLVVMYHHKLQSYASPGNISRLRPCTHRTMWVWFVTSPVRYHVFKMI